MGNNQTKELTIDTELCCAKSFAELHRQIEFANAICRIYKNKDGLHLSFHVCPQELDAVAVIFWKFVVKVIAVKVNEKEVVVNKKRKYLSLKQFYILMQLIQKLLTTKDFQSIDEDEVFGECSICMDGRADIILPCTHSFCNTCINDWQARSRTCPMCRELSNSDDVFVVVDEEEVVDQQNLIEDVNLKIDPFFREYIDIIKASRSSNQS